MIVLVLLLIWAAVLAPFLLRKFADRRAIESVSRFRQTTGNLRAAYPRIAAVSDPVSPRGAAIRHGSGMPISAEERRLLRQRVARQRARRRQALTVLVGTLVTTLMLGMVPALRVLWVLTVASGLLTGCYIAMAVYFANTEATALERRSKVVPLRDGRSRPQPRHALAAAGMAGGPAPIERRPSFVLVASEHRYAGGAG